MAGHGIRMMTIVFGGMIKMIIGCLVRPLVKEVPMDMLICIMMEDKYLAADSVIAYYDWFVRIKSILSHDSTKRTFRL